MAAPPGGWLWVSATPVATIFMHCLSRSATAAQELLGHSFAGTVVSDRYSAYNYLPLEQRQICWAHLIRDITAIAERSGVSGETGTNLDCPSPWRGDALLAAGSLTQASELRTG